MHEMHEEEQPADPEREIEDLLRTVLDDFAPEPAHDLVRRTISRVRGMVLFRDLMAFATFESFWESLKRGRLRGASDEEHRNR